MSKLAVIFGQYHNPKPNKTQTKSSDLTIKKEKVTFKFVLIDVNAHGEHGSVNRPTLTHKPVLNIRPVLVQKHEGILWQHISQLGWLLEAPLALDPNRELGLGAERVDLYWLGTKGQVCEGWLEAKS